MSAPVKVTFYKCDSVYISLVFMLLLNCKHKFTVAKLIEQQIPHCAAKDIFLDRR